ncbi:MAG TPA: DEAD/DEAH box helicase family protein [Clostridiales bacterium]|nr:DEAD/DEAH box helicase family protein [Clostridiales bacterium]
MELGVLNEIKSHLRSYQRDAVNKIESYLRTEEMGQILIKMPTGTGKTGVIATASEINDNDSILIITPNSTLPGQISKEICTEFWEKIDYLYVGLKKIIMLSNVIDTKSIDFTYSCIIITTIQQLCAIYNERQEEFSELTSHIRLVIFDEGHREYADVWKTVVDNFNCKKILFTATPYRNDT